MHRYLKKHKISKHKTRKTMGLIKEVRSIRFNLTDAELAELAQQSATANIAIEDKKAQAKVIASQFSTEVKELEVQRGDLSHRIISRTEQRDVLCHVRKNYDTFMIEYISMDGEVIDTEPFSIKDHRKQLELKEEVAQTKLEKIEYFGMKYFYEQFLAINFEVDVTSQEVDKVLEENKSKFVALCVTYLVDEKKMLNLEDDVEFDAMYDVISGWYDKFAQRYMTEPKLEDYPQADEEEHLQEAITLEQAQEQEPENEEPAEPKKKGRKKKEIQAEEESEEENNDDENEIPDWLR